MEGDHPLEDDARRAAGAPTGRAEPVHVGAGLLRRSHPSDEYRAVTNEEWDQFEEHFAKRKIAIGDCMRAYGTNCVHEYACEQCKLARPDLDAQPRLQRVRQGLIDQTDEARERGWHGEIERLTHILAAVDDKLAEIERARRRITIVAVPTPRTKTAAHRGEPAQRSG